MKATSGWLSVGSRMAPKKLGCTGKKFNYAYRFRCIFNIIPCTLYYNYNENIIIIIMTIIPVHHLQLYIINKTERLSCKGGHGSMRVVKRLKGYWLSVALRISA